MDITYLGHSCFKLKTSDATVITDPFSSDIGLSMPKVSADVVTVSHQHSDHNNIKSVTGTARRDHPFIIDAPGEYEVGGISVFGIHTFHDDKEGAERGGNVVYSVVLDGISVVHLGDLGHELTSGQLDEIDGADVLLCPVGGHYTIKPSLVSEIVSQLEPSILIPMHYKTPQHDQSSFSELITIDEFLSSFGAQVNRTDKLSVTKSSLPEELEVVVLES